MTVMWKWKRWHDAAGDCWMASRGLVTLTVRRPSRDLWWASVWVQGRTVSELYVSAGRSHTTRKIAQQAAQNKAPAVLRGAYVTIVREMRRLDVEIPDED